MKMKDQIGRMVFLAVIVIALMCSPVLKVEGASSGSGEWEYTLTPYLWLIDADGDVTVSGTSVPFNLDFDDAIDFTNIAAMARFEAWKGNLGYTFDVLYLDLEKDVTTQVANIEVNYESVIIEAGVSYLVGEMPLAETSENTLSFEAMAGGRFTYFKTQLEFTPGPSRDVNKDWIEPFVGARIKLNTPGKWGFVLRGDVGGFDIGSGSELTWNFVAGVDYQLSEATSLQFGYKILDIDYEKGSGTNKHGLDEQLSGPGIAVTFHF